MRMGTHICSSWLTCMSKSPTKLRATSSLVSPLLVTSSMFAQKSIWFHQHTSTIVSAGTHMPSVLDVNKALLAILVWCDLRFCGPFRPSQAQGQMLYVLAIQNSYLGGNSLNPAISYWGFAADRNGAANGSNLCSNYRIYPYAQMTASFQLTIHSLWDGCASLKNNTSIFLCQVVL